MNCNRLYLLHHENGYMHVYMIISSIKGILNYFFQKSMLFDKLKEHTEIHMFTRLYSFINLPHRVIKQQSYKLCVS